jgi:hypothetical protein
MRATMGIEDDRLEFFGTEMEKLVAGLKVRGGGRLVCGADGKWKVDAALPPKGSRVVDVDHKGRVREYVV